MIEKHIYSRNRNKRQVNLVKQQLVDRKLRVQWSSDYPSTTQMVSHVIVSCWWTPSNALVDVYLWRRASPLCQKYNTRLPPGPYLPKRIGNTHPCNYNNLKGKDIDVHFSFFFLSRGIILWVELMRPNMVKTADQCFHLSCVSVHRIFWSW